MGQTPAWMLLALAILPATAAAQDARAVIEEASRAMGVTGLTSVTWSGAAAEGNFGQSRTISFGLASTTISTYTHTIDFARGMSRTTGIATPPTGRGSPPSQAFRIDRAVAAGSGWPDQFQIWVTPWGFLRGAAANAATVRTQRIDGVAYRVVTWVPPLKAPSGQSYRVVGYLNPDNFVERV